MNLKPKNNQFAGLMSMHSGCPLLNVREAASILGISVPTFWRRVADGTIPKPVKLGGASRWPVSEITHVIEKAMASRD